MTRAATAAAEATKAAAAAAAAERAEAAEVNELCRQRQATRSALQSAAGAPRRASVSTHAAAAAPPPAVLLESVMAMQVGAQCVWTEFAFTLAADRRLRFVTTKPPIFNGTIDLQSAREARCPLGPPLPQTCARMRC